MKDLRDTIPHPFQPVVEASDTEQIICNTCIKIAKEYLKEGFYRIVFFGFFRHHLQRVNHNKKAMTS